jgi:hypothetical protein
MKNYQFSILSVLCLLVCWATLPVAAQSERVFQAGAAASNITR